MQCEPADPSHLDKLDQLAVEILKYMQEYINHKKIIEDYIRGGCLDLAKSRYLTSNTNISALQLPSEDSDGITATFRIETSETDVPTFQKHVPQIESITETLEGLEIKNDDDGGDKQIKRFSNDPLKWFGVLVPQSLRQSQNKFIKCLELIIECSNIQVQLIKSIESYEDIKRRIRE